jgi:hypothetical protein
MDWLIRVLKIKLILYWITVYIVVQIFEFLVTKFIFKWMFGSKDEPEQKKA